MFVLHFSYRFDHFQMGSSVVVSVYAKLCDPEKSFVEANYTCVSTMYVYVRVQSLDE